MLYTKYSKKMLRIATVLKTIKRFRVLIICCISALLGIIATLIGTNGLVYDKGEFPSQVVCGDDYGYTAGAFLNSVRYEYRADGSEEWSEEKPIRAGKYVVRAVSKRTGGAPSYGKEHAFEILPRPVEITIAEKVVYGEYPKVYAESVYGDTVTCTEFVYADLSKTTTSVTAVPSGVRFTDPSGNDVTDSYAFAAAEGEIEFIPRKIEVTVADAKGVYNGKPFKSEVFEVSGGTLAGGDTLVAVFENSRTDVGTETNAPDLKVVAKDGKDVSVNYDITEISGKLSVEKRPLQVTTAGASKTYDGTPLTCADYTIDTATPLADGHTLTVEINSSRTDVGKTKNRNAGFKVTDAGGEDVTENYSLTFTYGDLEVTKRSLKLSTASATFEYDGQAHSLPELTQCGELPDGHKAEFSPDRAASLTDVGQCKNDKGIRILFGDADKTDCFDIDGDYGTLTVKPRKITVTTYDVTREYNGKMQTGGIFDVSYGGTDFSADGAALVPGHTARLDESTLSGITYIEESGKTNTFSVGIFSGDTDVSENYSVTYIYGKLYILKRKVTVYTGSASHEYDARAFSYGVIERDVYGGELDIAQAEEGIVSGDKAFVIDETLTFVTDVFDSGTENKFEIEIRADLQDSYDVTGENGDGSESADRTANYEISYIYGTLSVTQRPVAVISESATFEYDGNIHDFRKYSLEYTGSYLSPDDSPIVPGQTESVTACTSVQYVTGEDGVPNVLTLSVTASDGSDVTHNYRFTSIESGTLAVTPRPVKVITADGEWEYDADAHSLPEYNVVYNGEEKTYEDNGETKEKLPLVGNHKHRVVGDIATVCEVSDTAAHNNVFEVAITGDGASGNYKIDYEYGTLTVTPRPVLVTTPSHKWVYDGDFHEGGEFTVEYNGSKKTFVENGEAKEKPATVGSQKAVVSGDLPKVKNVADTTDNNNKFSVVVRFGETDKSENYDIKYAYGTIGIVPRPVIATSKSEVWEYDGQAHKKEEASSEFDSEAEIDEDVDSDFDRTFGLVSGHEFTFDTRVSTTVTDYTPRPVTNSLSVTGVSSAVGDESGNYAVRTDNIGTLTITKRPVLVTTASHNWVYDGDFRADGGFTVEYNGSEKTFVENGEVKEKPAIVGSQTAVVSGELPKVKNVSDTENNNNKFKVVVLLGETDMSVNYDIVYEYGTIGIVPRPIVVTSNSSSHEYDGEGYSDSKHFDAYDLEFSFEPSLGISDSEINKSFGIVSGQSSHAVSYKTVHEVSDTRDHNNVIAIEITGDGAEIGNYEIRYDYGKLTVTPRPILIKTPSHKWVYDGDFHEDREFTIEYNGSEKTFVENGETKRKPAIVGEQKAVVSGDVPKVKNVADTKNNNNKFSVVVLLGETDKSNNYEIKYAYGTIGIVPRPVIATSKSEVWEYDGQAHKKEEASSAFDSEAEIDEDVDSDFDRTFGLVDGHKFTFDTTASTTVTDYTPTPVTNSLSVTGVSSAVGDESGNYIVRTVSSGTLEITKRKIEIITSTESFVYDGKPHSSETVSVLYRGDRTDIAESDGLVSGHKTKALDPVPTITDAGNKENRFEIAILDAGGKDVSRNYAYDGTSYTYGKISVTARPITVTTPTHSWEYDGRSHSDTVIASDSVKYTGSDSEEGLVCEHKVRITKDSAVPEITDVGTERNVFTVEVVTSDGKEVKPENYKITCDYGTLSVTPRPIEIKASGGTWEYDGKEHKNDSGYTLLYKGEYLEPDNTPLVNGHSKTVVSSTVVTDVCSGVKNELVIKITDSSGRDVTGNYKVTQSQSSGTLKVTPRPIKITTASRTFVYDGQYHSYPEATATYAGTDLNADALVGGASLKAIGSVPGITNVGTAVNKFAVTVVDASGKDISKNYSIADSYTYGTLEVVKRPIELLSASRTWEYDEREHSYPYITTTFSAEYFERLYAQIDNMETYDTSFGLVGTDKFVIANYATITEVGECENRLEVTAQSLAEIGNNYAVLGTEFVNGNVVSGGTLKVIEPQIDPKPDPPPGEPDEPFALLDITADYSGRIYLRSESYGDFTGNAWRSAPAYGGKTDSGMNFIASEVLAQSGKTLHTAHIELKDLGDTVYYPYSLPYYAVPSDYDRSLIVYDAMFYGYDFLRDGTSCLTPLSGVAAAEEAAYRAFVKQNYKNIPSSTKAYFDANGFASRFANADTLIADVARFIQSSAKYNLEYDSGLDAASDRVVAFLETYKEGVCRHYAEAATMLYRYLGVPARYVTGCTDEVVSGVKKTVMSGNAHAWTEVYVDGYGWMAVEVTGSPDGSQGGDEKDPDEGKENAITVLMPGYSETYSGSPLVFDTSDTGCEYYVLDEEIDAKYDVRLYFRVEQSEVGKLTAAGLKARLVESGEKWYTVIERATGKDVTSDFVIVFEADNGEYILSVEAASVTVTALNATKVYTGEPLTAEDAGYNVTGLPAGFTAEVTLVGSRTEVGTADAIVEKVIIINESGENVSKNFTVTTISGLLTVVSPK